jgi:hypothetical protein
MEGATENNNNHQRFLYWPRPTHTCQNRNKKSREALPLITIFVPVGMARGHAVLLCLEAVPVAPAAGVLELLASGVPAVVVPPRDLRY